MNILQAIADFATVTNVKRSTRKLLFIQKKKLLFTVLAHPASTPCCTHVQTCVDAAGLYVQVGSQHISWHTTHHCMGEVLCQSGLSLPEVSSSYSCLCLTQEQNLLLRGSLHITVFCVVPLSVTIEWETFALTAHMEHACSVLPSFT